MTKFPDHTVESAPVASRRAIEATSKRFGYLPTAVSRLASSPPLLDGFLKISGLFETTTLDPVAREVLILTISTRNECHVCVAIHTAKLTALGADPDLIVALRERKPLADGKLEAVRLFTLAVIADAGAVDESQWEAFLGHGYTTQNALEIVLGIGAYTMSTLANRMTEAPLDEQLEPFAWTSKAA